MKSSKIFICMVIMALLVSMVPMAFAQENTAHLTVVHDVETAPPVDVYVNEVSGTPAVVGLTYGEESAQLDLEAGTYTVFVVPAGALSPVLIEASLELEAGKTYKATAATVDGEATLTLEEAGATEETPTAEATEEGTVEETPTEEPTELPTIAEIALGNEDFSTLVQAVTAADPAVLEMVGGEGPLTVFAPNNAAFETLPPGVLDAVLGSPPSITAILQAHVAEGKLTLADLTDGTEIQTAFPPVKLTVSVDDEGNIFLLVNGDEATAVKVAGTEVEASNGNVIVLEGVILPPRPGTEEPTEEATEEGVTEETPTEEATEEGTTEETAVGNIPEVAATRSDLATFTAALGFVTVGDALTAEGPLTVFAPNEDAFNNNQEAVGLLLSNLDLANATFEYHVVAGLYTAEQLLEMDGQTLTSLEGTELTITVEDDTVLVNGIKVLEADIAASNGVIHVIEGILLLPEEGTTEPTEEATTELQSIAVLGATNEDFSTLVQAVAAADPSVMEMVSGTGDFEGKEYTVFAPPNAAFEALPEGVLEAVLASQPSITAILQAHVVEGKLTLEQLAEMNDEVLETLFEGTTLTVKVDEEGKITLLVNGNEETVIELAGVEVEASNGNIIVINSVILPEMPTEAPESSN